MLKTIARISLCAALCLPPVLAVLRRRVTASNPALRPRRASTGRGTEPTRARIAQGQARSIAANSVRKRATIITPPITD
jgi:hypothetical protein